jgi:hypothetical protein
MNWSTRRSVAPLSFFWSKLVEFSRNWSKSVEKPGSGPRVLSFFQRTQPRTFPGLFRSRFPEGRARHSPRGAGSSYVVPSPCVPPVSRRAATLATTHPAAPPSLALDSRPESFSGLVFGLAFSTFHSYIDACQPKRFQKK